jgi:hypothetical protein
MCGIAKEMGEWLQLTEMTGMVQDALNVDLRWFGVTRLNLEGRRLLESTITKKNSL